jgi:hypothetical protein
MSSLNRATVHFTNRRLSPEQFVIGHLSDDFARLYARDLYLIGYVEESKILSGNDTSKYTAILNKDNGQACEVFFDLPQEPELQAIVNVRGREHTTQISN